MELACLKCGKIYERMQLAVKLERRPSWQLRSRNGCHTGPTGQGRVSTSYNKQRGGHHQHRSRTVQTVQFTH